MKRLLPVILLVCLAITARAATNTLEVFDFDFGTAPSAHVDPVIQVGDTVQWVWTSGTPHSSTSAGGQLESWNSGLHSQPFIFSQIFTHVGTFTYYCTAHGTNPSGTNVTGMSGRVFVENPDVQSYVAAAKGQLFEQLAE